MMGGGMPFLKSGGEESLYWRVESILLAEVVAFGENNMLERDTQPKATVKASALDPQKRNEIVDTEIVNIVAATTEKEAENSDDEQGSEASEFVEAPQRARYDAKEEMRNSQKRRPGTMGCLELEV
ncbi:hypothetical protein L195_g002147 [Trifolium pratense]|uniref:Uncharacterized protein n=1 Tax=Trifolium pratense TaxID=57577 RepID=A0A2K3NRN0_TRIPR|nr:hypothetical protein L195_g002147 [Trifolium pratense]